MSSESESHDVSTESVTEFDPVTEDEPEFDERLKRLYLSESKYIPLSNWEYADIKDNKLVEKEINYNGKITKVKIKLVDENDKLPAIPKEIKSMFQKLKPKKITKKKCSK